MTPEEEKQLKQMCEKLRAYYKTQEGQEVGKQISNFLEQKKTVEAAKARELTERERVAFKFIKEQLLLKTQPTVREVAWATGCRSSRSGARLVNVLVEKGFLKRQRAGNLIVQ